MHTLAVSSPLTFQNFLDSKPLKSRELMFGFFSFRSCQSEGCHLLPHGRRCY